MPAEMVCSIHSMSGTSKQMSSSTNLLQKPNLLPSATGYGWENSRDDRELLLFALIHEIRDDQGLCSLLLIRGYFLRPNNIHSVLVALGLFVPPILLGTGVTLAWFAGKVLPGIGSLLHKQQAAFTWLNDLSVGELYSAQSVFLLARQISCSQFSHPGQLFHFQ